MKIGINEDFEIQGNYFRHNSSVLAVMKVNESKALFEAYLADNQESTTTATTSTITGLYFHRVHHNVDYLKKPFFLIFLQSIP